MFGECFFFPAFQEIKNKTSLVDNNTNLSWYFMTKKKYKKDFYRTQKNIFPNIFQVRALVSPEYQALLWHCRRTIFQKVWLLLNFTFTLLRHESKKMVKHTQIIRRQCPTNCLDMFEYFVVSGYKGSIFFIGDLNQK